MVLSIDGKVAEVAGEQILSDRKQVDLKVKTETATLENLNEGNTGIFFDGQLKLVTRHNNRLYSITYTEGT